MIIISLSAHAELTHPNRKFSNFSNGRRRISTYVNESETIRTNWTTFVPRHCHIPAGSIHGETDRMGHYHRTYGSWRMLIRGGRIEQKLGQSSQSAVAVETNIRIKADPMGKNAKK